MSDRQWPGLIRTDRPGQQGILELGATTTSGERLEKGQAAVGSTAHSSSRSQRRHQSCT